MKASEIISMLGHLIETYGDSPVYIGGYYSEDDEVTDLVIWGGRWYFWPFSSCTYVTRDAEGRRGEGEIFSLTRGLTREKDLYD